MQILREKKESRTTLSFFGKNNWKGGIGISWNGEDSRMRRFEEKDWGFIKFEMLDIQIEMLKR